MTPTTPEDSRIRAGAARRDRRWLGMAAVWCAGALGCVLAAACLAHGPAEPAHTLAALHHLLGSGSLYRMGFAIDVVALACLLA